MPFPWRSSHPPQSAGAADSDAVGAGSSGPSKADSMAALFAMLDPAAVGSLRELDPAGASGLVVRVLKAFQGSLQRLLQQLLTARAAKDAVTLKLVAHTLKSSSASVGALELSKLCADIERMIRQDETDGLDPLLDGMVAQSNRILAVLKPALDP